MAMITDECYGKLRIIEKVKKNNRIYYRCICKCGNECIVRSDSLRSGDTRSCGCGLKDKVKIDKLRENAGYISGTQLNKLDSKITKSNKSGIVGVNWDKARGKWQASIRFQNKKYNLGRFSNIHDAINCRKNAEEEIFGKFKNKIYNDKSTIKKI